jgi:hypothetical protein
MIHRLVHRECQCKEVRGNKKYKINVEKCGCFLSFNS